MEKLNKYGGLSKYRIAKIAKIFCLDIDATKCAELLSYNRKTINRYYKIFREEIAREQELLKKKMIGTVEVDESYFGGNRPRGVTGPKKRGRGTSKQCVFGIYQRGEIVYTELISDVKKATLVPIIRGKVRVTTKVVSDCWKGYNGLVDVGYDKHYRVNHSKGFKTKGNHINGIESFWSFTKRRLNKFNGVKFNFYLHLKESEWRWNKSKDELLMNLLKILKKR